MIEVVALATDEYIASIPALAGLLVDAVAGGASVNFVASVTPEDAAAWWRGRVPLVANGTISAFVARRDGDVVGSTLVIRSRNQNSPHRAEIGKVLVHRSVRRRGIGRQLMDAAEALARADGRWMLMLDTQAGSDADSFYRSLGWNAFGTMPNHAYTAAGVLAPTTFFWKDLR